MNIIDDFKSLHRKSERLDQKAEFDAKNPKVDPNKVVWSPEWGYGMVPVPFAAELMEADKAEPEAVVRSMSELLAWLGDDVAARWAGL